LVREGKGYGLDRFSRALTRLGYKSFDREYPRRFLLSTAGPLRIKSSVWYGDGSMHTVETYDHQAPLEVNMAQELFLTLLRNPYWERELTEEQCNEVR
jgi:hypothetical protein